MFYKAGDCMAGPKKILNWMSIDVDPDVITRYQKKKKVPPAKKPVEFETRYHRTHSKNAPSIDKQGLLTFNPNIGKNTYLSNADDYHNIWLANNATEIPVLRRLLEDSPQDVTTYKVRLPKQWYLDSPRFYMPGGRGSGVFKPQPKDKPRLTDEGSYKIDLIGNDIPPQYLQKLPVFNRDRRDIIGIIGDEAAAPWPYEYLSKNVYGELRNYNRASKQPVKRRLSKSQSWSRITPSEELLQAIFPMGYKYDIYRDFLQTANKLKHDFANLPPGIQVSPREMLDRTLSLTPYSLFPETGVLGSNATAKLKPTDVTQLAQGSISRAIEYTPDAQKLAKQRSRGSLDWDRFTSRLVNSSPYDAFRGAYTPTKILAFDELGKPYIKKLPVNNARGIISHGYDKNTSPLKSSLDIHYGLLDLRADGAGVPMSIRPDLFDLATYANIMSSRLPNQINNPKAQAILNKRIDKLPIMAIQDYDKIFKAGPIKDYVLSRVKARTKARDKAYADADDILQKLMRSRRSQLNLKDVRKLVSRGLDAYNIEHGQTSKYAWPKEFIYKNIIGSDRWVSQLSSNDRRALDNIINEMIEQRSTFK